MEILCISSSRAELREHMIKGDWTLKQCYQAQLPSNYEGYYRYLSNRIRQLI
jgi:hypothetical protein